MKITLIGSNGLLSDSIGKYCNTCNIKLTVWGLYKPLNHKFTTFKQVDLFANQYDYSSIISSDIIIYAVGAGIQSNLNENADLIYKLNIFTPVHLCNELEKAGFKGTFITFGSYFEIGENTENIEFDEVSLSNSMRNIPNDYCVSKRMLTRFLNSKQHKFKYIHAILPTIYGESESNHRLIPYTVKALKKGEELMFTSGNQVRQYLYINDVPLILFELVNRNLSGIYNMPGNETFTVKQLVKTIFEFYNKSFSDDIFGSVQRADQGMVNLQMCGQKLHSVIPEFRYSNFTENLKKYDLCL